MTPASVPVPPADRAEIVDALYRFGAGQDLRDRAPFESAFSERATLDFTQPAERLGAMIPVFEGRQNIADAVFANIRELDTTHTITNPRITTYDGEHASLFALVQAQHVPKRNHARHLLLANIYRLELTKQGESWAIDHMRIDNVWMTGEKGVLFEKGVGD